MKRSEINQILRDNLALCEKYCFKLPVWGTWSVDQWLAADSSFDEVRECKLGWDVTDYGTGDYAKGGLSLFTIRNGHPHMSKKYKKTYCEKLLIVGENQITPYHFHWAKTEDIICREGGNLLVKTYNSTPDEDYDMKNPVPVFVDGHHYKVEPGAIIRLTPGESITLPAFNYHSFWGEEGTGAVLVGEVSMVNDDENDNRFHDTVGRFPVIEEDEEPLHLLCSEYPAAMPNWMKLKLGL